MMEIDGVFKVESNSEGKKHLEMASEPLTENAVIFGPSIRNSATLQVKEATKKEEVILVLVLGYMAFQVLG